MTAPVSSLPIAVAGATGRMGHMLIEAILDTDDCRLSGALDIAASPALGQDAAAWLGKATGVAVSSDLRAGLKDSQFLIDFTRPEGTMAHLQVCRELGVKAVIGTTGFSEAQKAEIADIAKDIAIGYRRAHRGHAQIVEPRHLRPGQPARGALPGRPAARPVRHVRRPEPALNP